MYKYKHSYLILLDRIVTLRQELELVSEKDFPDDAPFKVINVLSVMIDCIESQSKKYLQAGPGTDERLKKHYLTFIRNMLTHLEQIHNLIGVVANGSKSSVPWALTRVVSEVLDHYKDPKQVEVIYAPIWRLNFTIHPHRLLELYEYLEEILEETEDGKKLKEKLTRVIAINFSYLDRKSPLLYGVLGHEIGHIFSTDFFESAKDFNDKWKNNELIPVIASLKDPRNEARFFGELLKARQRAIEELGADLFAVHTVGPAFVFSLFDVLTRFSEDLTPSEANNFYPSNRLRLSVILQALTNKWDFEKDVSADDLAKKDFAKALKILSEIANDGTIVDNTPKSSQAVQLAYNYVLNHDIPEMLKDLENKVRPFNYDLFFKQAYELSTRLENLIPPNQTGVDLDSWADSLTILNVTWLTEVRTIWNTDWKNLGNDQHLERLYMHDRLALKAIELSEIQRSYEDGKKV